MAGIPQRQAGHELRFLMSDLCEHPVLTPPSEIAIGTWIGRLELDGAIRGQASWKAGPKWKAGGHPFTFTRRP